MEENIKVSIIVPVYKVEQYIKECIESLINQTLRDIEIILVNDGSPDRCGEICDQYANKDERIKVIHKINGGVSAARNDGLKLATGKWVIFCDADDTMELTACETLYNAGEINAADVVIGDVYRVFKDKKVYAQFFKEPFVITERQELNDLVRVDFSRKYCHSIPEGGPAFGYGGPWNKLVRRKFLIDKNITFDQSLKGIFDDILYTAYLYATATKVVYITEAVYNYRILQSSITHTYKANLPEINKAIFKAWTKFLNQYGANGEFDEAYYVLVIRRLKGLLGLYFFSEKNNNSLKKQRIELKSLIKSEPYNSAIKKVNPKKLINLYDVAVWLMAKLNSGLGMQMVYKLFIMIKK